MFSSGNGSERGRVTTWDVGDEIVVDMFAGIGYFAVPLVASKFPAEKRHRKRPTELCGSRSKGGGVDEANERYGRSFTQKQVRKLIAIEKNPDSFVCLLRNISLNGLGPFVTPILGDNREVGNTWLDQAQRVLMGYFPGTEKFLFRALRFLDSSTGGTVHYHHLCRKIHFQYLAICHIVQALFCSDPSFVSGMDATPQCPTDMDSLASFFTSFLPYPLIRLYYDHLNRMVLSCEMGPLVTTHAFTVVKSYSPHTFHCVADIHVTPNSLQTPLSTSHHS